VTTNEPLPDPRPGDSIPILVLEWFTAAVLLLVLVALAWMAAADVLPASCHLASLEVEILGVLGLLVAALLLVSVLALLPTPDGSAD
jgi:hypothetical protein